MPEFQVEVDEQYAHLAELCYMYWATNGDGSFTYTVKALSEQFTQPSHKISKIVAEACFASSASRRCSECSKGFVYRSRSDWNSSARFAPSRCRTCIEAERRRQEERRERVNAAMRVEVLQRYAIRSSDCTPRAVDLDLTAAFALAALFEDAEEISRGTTVPIAERTDLLSPTADYDFKLVELVAGQGLVRVHPSSRLESFVWRDDGNLGDGFYPTLASYYLPGKGALVSRVEEYLESFTQVASRETWPDHWVDQFSDFWFDVAVSECKAYLVHMLQRHDLEFSPGQKTDDVLRHALRWYSIGQVYYFIWAAARDSAYPFRPVIDQAVCGGIQWLPARASRRASSGCTPWLRAVAR